MQTQLGTQVTELREQFSSAKKVLVLTGAGVSAESGVPNVSRWRELSRLERNAVRRDIVGANGRTRSTRSLGVVRLSPWSLESGRAQSCALRDRKLAG